MFTPAHTGEVAWAVTGRFYGQSDGSAFDAGYFLDLVGLPELFSGAPAARTAHLTFLAAPFTAQKVTNGPITLGLDPTGDFRVFYQRAAMAHFDDPSSFGAGQCVGVFRRRHVVMGTTLGQITNNLFTATLERSHPFEHAGQRWDLRRLLGRGVTQSGIASMAPLTPPPGMASCIAFSGTAVALGHVRP